MLTHIQYRVSRVLNFRYEDTDHIYIHPDTDSNDVLNVYAYLLINNCVQWLEKVFIPLELFHILSRYNHKHKCISLGFHVIDQHNVAHDCEVEGKWYLVVFKYFQK